MCYVYNQCYDISCATLYMKMTGHTDDPDYLQTEKNYPVRFQRLSGDLRKDNTCFNRDSNRDTTPDQPEASSQVSVPYWH
jgi:hypothetical protein